MRQCQAQAYRDWAAQNFAEPRIIGGDFNDGPTDPGPVAWMTVTSRSPGYYDGWASSAPQTLYTGDTDTGVRPSDHLPLTVIVSIP